MNFESFDVSKIDVIFSYPLLIIMKSFNIIQAQLINKLKNESGKVRYKIFSG